MSIVAISAGIGNLAERLACQYPAMQKPYGVIQTKRLDEIAAGRAPEREELLKVAYGNPQFGCYLTRAEIVDRQSDPQRRCFRMLTARARAALSFMGLQLGRCSTNLWGLVGQRRTVFVPS
jgi:hypothetical protein